ncbi:NAD(P)-dependent dehydrogenase (short-subunit alcohol dehydrogenase family) [Dysgonomonas hofstadii]|uniref:NAD(P)-dependent dehydrogenase (Short-subunit alcohol dehydrogenase family) n=1 Tax=Dysgonomonas hofstadii TaxID=637886 RepID=A0A840CV20_9BACT|nr:D-threitol dehydrogenase [Dysgonomonas hofstadii]MBB4035633.1 NAD(P)-dependent dehydrogenase (short-subunit alcohol dehydrogenase family) [Dysgonomonas hofstadii]
MLKYFGADASFALDGQVAIVTGGANGIGKATADLFIKKGVKVVLGDYKADVAETAKLFGENCLGVQVDVTKEVDRLNLIRQALDKFGKIDILVNCAGMVALESALDVEDKDWEDLIAVNLMGTFKMNQEVARYMVANKVNGSIVNIASQAGTIALDKHVAYSVTKAGVISMTKVLAFEWGKYGIRVNSVSPTVVLTEMGHKAWDGPQGDAFRKDIPSGRFAETDEIAGPIVFLCSGAAGMITGHDLLVDGGYTIK